MMRKLLALLCLGILIGCAPMPIEKTIIASPDAPGAIGPYSQAVQVGNMLYLSGQLGMVPSTGDFAEGGIEAQHHVGGIGHVEGKSRLAERDFEIGRAEDGDRRSWRGDGLQVLGGGIAGCEELIEGHLDTETSHFFLVGSAVFR